MSAGDQIRLGCPSYNKGPDDMGGLEWVRGGVVLSRGGVLSAGYVERAGVSVEEGVPGLSIQQAMEGDAGHYQCQYEGEQLDTYLVVVTGSMD